MTYFLGTLVTLLYCYWQTSAQEVYECETSSPSSVCILRGVTIASPDDINSIELPEGQPGVQFIDGTIPEFGRLIYDQLESTTNLTISNSGVDKLFVGPLLVYLNASGNKIVRVDSRASTQDYSVLRVLILSSNQFVRIPNVKDFIGLELLDLSYNAIEFANLDLFGRLTQLKVLDLSSNKIRSLDTEKGFRLPTLTELRLGSNQLLEVDFVKWKLPNLLKLDIGSNLLLYLNENDIEKPLSKLSHMNVQGNQWNCHGLQNLIQFLQKKYISFISGGLFQCPSNWTSRQGVCCQDSYVNYVTLHSQWEIRKLQREMKSMNETLVVKLAAVRDEQGVQIAQLEDRLMAQLTEMVDMKMKLTSMEQMIEDLIEELYLRQMENEAGQGLARKMPSVTIVY